MHCCTVEAVATNQLMQCSVSALEHKYEEDKVRSSVHGVELEGVLKPAGYMCYFCWLESLVSRELIRSGIGTYIGVCSMSYALLA
jgi:hypothetical protein